MGALRFIEKSWSLAILVICSAVLMVPAAAQENDAESLRTQGEALVYGLNGTQPDVAAGMSLLMQSAETGDVVAKAELGKILLDGHYTEADPDRALPLLEAAVAEGNGQAQATLGGALLWGETYPADPKRAEALLRAAATSGSIEAKRILGAQLIGGWVLDRDVAEGLPLLEEAAQKDPEAQVELGTFLLYGESLPANPDRALTLFESAAESGNGKGLERYGKALMWSLKDPEGAEKYLRRAAELGQASAWSILAEGAMYGYFGLDPASRRRFVEFAEAARAAGDQRMEILDAARQMWGISMRANGPLTLEKLYAAADAKNKDAAQFLIALLRDGNQMNIRRDLAAAREVLSKYGPLMSARDVRQYGLTLAVAEARERKDFAALDGAVRRNMAAHPEDMTQWLGQEFFKANPNAAIYLLQVRMRDAKLFQGALDGFAGRKTIAALNRACAQLAIGDKCDDSVMRPDVLGAILAGL